MEYTVQRLGKLAGISSRTIRYYDEIGILKPARINSSGYRLYGQAEVDLLQHILFYRELGVSLDEIKNIINAPGFDELNALKEHHDKLLDRREQLDILIANVEKTISLKERGSTMTNQEKFEGFKQKLIDDNEKKYGAEVREKYGDKAIEQSNRKIKGLTQEQYNKFTMLSKELDEVLHTAFQTGDPAGEAAQKAADLHRQWLSYFWDSYCQEAHAGLAQMYVDDERFTAYYDKKQKGTAAFLRDAILIYTKPKE